MKISVKYLVIISIAFTLGACSRSVPTTNQGTNNSAYINYGEDLSSVRPHYDDISQTTGATSTPQKQKPVIITDVPLEVNRKVEAVLDTMANQNKSIKFATGYRIQMYVGNNLQEVDNAKLFVIQNFPELNNYVSYNQPTYKLKIGDFMTRMDAERYYNTIKVTFYGANIITDKIDVRKSLLAK